MEVKSSFLTFTCPFALATRSQKYTIQDSVTMIHHVTVHSPQCTPQPLHLHCAAGQRARV